MTTETRPTTEALIARHLTIQQAQKQLAEERYALEQELQARMEADSATVLLGLDGARVELVYPSPTYNNGILMEVLELLPPGAEAEMARGYIHAHEEIVQVAARFDMRQVKTWVKFGKEIADTIERAKIPGRPGLKVTRKEQVNGS